MEPIIGRTHTDLYKTRGRMTNIGGPGGLKLTYLSANGFSYAQVGLFVGTIMVWAVPLMKFGVPLFGWGGMSLLLLFGPPAALAYAADRTLPHGKSLTQWVTTRFRYHVLEKRAYVAGKPAPPIATVVVRCDVWTPPKEGLRV